MRPLYKLTITPGENFKAEVYQLDSSLIGQVTYLYEDRGVKTYGFIADNLKRKEIDVDASICPEIPKLFEKIRQAFNENLTRFDMTKRGDIYTDSPRVDHYYYSGAPSEVIELDMTEDNSILFTATDELKKYVEECAGKAGRIKVF